MNTVMYPYSRKTRTSVVSFGGLNRQTGIQTGQFSEMRGLSTASLPQITTHKGQTVVRTYEGAVQGLASCAAGLACAAGGKLYIDGTARLSGLSEGRKTILQFWSKVCVFPDKKYYDTDTGETGQIGTGTYPEAGSAPDIDFAVVHDNRIFGLSGKMLYACKPGDLTDWTTFVDDDGLPADNGAYALQMPGAGSYQGIASYSGHVIAFTESEMKMLYGTMPSKYSFVTACAFGCADNRSIAQARDSVFYLSSYGVHRFAGSVPVNAGLCLGSVPPAAIGAGTERCYYLAAGRLLYEYDTYNETWTVVREYDSEIAGLCVHEGALYAVCADGTLWRHGTQDEVSFSGTLAPVLGSISEKMRMTRLDVRYELAAGAELIVSASCDGGAFVPVLREAGTQETTPQIRTRRITLPKCRSYTLRVEGRGHMVLYDIQQTVCIGSDVDAGRMTP